MFAEHVTEDGFKLQVFTSLYMDWGLAIYNPDGDLVLENFHALSNECYGLKENDRYDDMESACKDYDNGVDDALVPWTEQDWGFFLALEADNLIESFHKE